jgi:regulatory associated protein of mTOR
MKPNEADEPGSLDYNQRLWRRTRNDKIIIDTQKQKERAVTSRWDHPRGLLNNLCQPTRLMFHQFEPHLVAVDDKDCVSMLHVLWCSVMFLTFETRKCKIEANMK